MVLKAVMAGMAAAALVLPRAAPAQETPRRISLDEATAMFAANSRALRAARADAAARAAATRASGQAPNPTLGATHESLSSGSRDAGETYVTLSQPLRWPWASGARGAAIRQASSAAEARVRADSLELLHAVRLAWVAAWLAERRQEALERAANVVRQAQSRGAERYRLGDISGLDRRRLDLERLRYDRLAAAGRLAVDSARRALGAAILAPDDAAPVAPGALPPAPLAATDTLSALDRHPAVERARARLAFASAEAAYEGALVTPGPTLTAGYKRQDDGLAGVYVGASLPVPVFDRRSGARAAARARVEAAESELAQAERLVRDAARQAIARHAAARELAGQLPAAPDPRQDVLAIALVAYEGGELDLTDLLATAASWRELGAQADEIRAEYWLSRFELERALGGSAPSREDGR